MYSTFFNFSKTFRFLIVMLLIGVLAVGAVSAQDNNAGLFEPTNAAADAPPMPGLLRSRAVNIDISNLSNNQADFMFGAPSQLTLNLFDDVTVLADLVLAQPRPTGAPGYVWYGNVVGDDLSDVQFIVTPDFVQGTVIYNNRTYKIDAYGTSTYTISELDPEAIVPLLQDDAVIPDGTPTGAPARPNYDEANADTAEFIDVLIVYTQAVENSKGGSAQAVAEAESLITLTNAGYEASGISQRLRLAGTHKTGLVETTADLGVYLDQITNADGVMDEVFAVRDSVGADLVALIVDNSPNLLYCGIAWLPKPNRTTTEDRGFSVTELICGGGNLSFPHELGHNMGASHNVENGGGANGGIFSYSFGYYDNGNFRTVMSYSNPCTSGCTRVNRWSNPGLTYNGRATGTNSGTYFGVPFQTRNYQTLNDTAIEVANYRQSKIQVVPPVGLNSPTGRVTVGASTQIGWTVPDGVTSVQVDVYNPSGSQIYSQDVSAASCSNGNCTATVNINNTFGEYSVYMQSKNGNNTGEWTLSKFYVGPGASSVSSPTTRVNPTNTVTVQFPLGTGAYFSVIDVYYPNGGYQRKVIEAPTSCTSVCSVDIETFGLWGNFSIWIVNGWGSFYSDWTNSTITVAPSPVTLTSPTGTIGYTTGNVTLTYNMPPEAYYAVVDIYYPNGGYQRYVQERPTACVGDVCSLSLPTYGLSGTYGVWIIPGWGSNFGVWEYSTFNMTAPDATLDADEVDVMGSAVEAPPSLDTSEVEAAVEGPGN